MICHIWYKCQPWTCLWYHGDWAGCGLKMRIWERWVWIQPLKLWARQLNIYPKLVFMSSINPRGTGLFSGLITKWTPFTIVTWFSHCHLIEGCKNILQSPFKRWNLTARPFVKSVFICPKHKMYRLCGWCKPTSYTRWVHDLSVFVRSLNLWPIS